MKKYPKYVIVTFILLLIIICGSLILHYGIFWPWDLAIIVPVIGIIGGLVIGGLVVVTIKNKNKNKNKRDIKDDIHDICNMLWGLPMIAGFIVFGDQVYLYLRDGVWIKMSVLYPFYKDWDWVSSPKDWVGLHSILEEIPLSLALILISIGAIYLFEIIFYDEV